MTECLFCGAGRDDPQKYSDSIDYLCGSVLGKMTGWHRTLRCAETQISHQAEIIREAREVVEAIINRNQREDAIIPGVIHCLDCGGFMLNSGGNPQHSGNCSLGKVQTLFPKMKAVEG